MESQESVEAAWKPRPERYALAIIVSSLTAAGLFALFVCLKYLCHVPGDTSAIALWFSLACAYFVTPLVGLMAVAVTHANWNLIAQSHSGDTAGDKIVRLARGFFIAGLLLVVLSGLPAVGAGVYGILWRPLLPVWLAGWLVLTALTASAMGCFAFRLFRAHGRILPGASAVALAMLGFVTAVATVLMTGPGAYVVQRAAYARRAVVFSANSAALEYSMVVPTLDTPCPPNRNIIWCSSFQLAWNEIRDKVIGAPLAVVGAEDVATRLNTAKQSGSDLESQSFYAAGGRIRDGAIDRIRKEMTDRFPSKALPDLDRYRNESGGILAYSYLTANVPFKYPFRQLDEGLSFTDSGGTKTKVAGFGLWEAHRLQYQNIREQVEILYAKNRGRERSWELEEYALDLCRHSNPYQVVVAMVERRGSLAETLAYVRLRIDEFQRRSDHEAVRSMEKYDVVEIPEMFWKIDHHFHELIGRLVSNAGLPIVEAMQTIEFRLDRYGATLESESVWMIAAIPRRFIFDRPFLVYMQKRGAEHPFFVMWVDNAELLTHK